jgi:putative membrane protein
MQALLIRLFINAIALWIAATVVPGIQLSNDFGEVLLVALAFGVVNAFVRPIVMFLAFPFIVLTLGLLSLVINAGMLMLTDAFTSGLAVGGFRAAFFGALVISVVNVFLGIGEEKG